jgi:aspartate kinase
MSKSIFVQKFGGTSVGTGDRLRSVAEIVINTARTNDVVVVVSALSPQKKASGTTSLLLKAGELAIRGDDPREALREIQGNHLEAVQGAVSSAPIRDRAISFIEDELEKLRSFLEAITVIRELSASSLDHLVAVGERLSAFVLALTIQDAGLSAEFVDLSSALEGLQESNGRRFFDIVQQRLVEECCPLVGACIPVITGFFGPVPGGLIGRVGRGYTDFTAAMITAGLGSERVAELQVWKEVDGICTADPRKVPEARVLSQISTVEAAELTHFGSEVLHPFTMERVTSSQIPIRVKNTFNPQALGTLVSSAPPGHSEPVTAITAKGGVTIVTLTTNKMYNAYGFLAEAFNVLKEQQIVVDVVSTSEISISFTVEKKENLDEVVRELSRLGEVSVQPGKAILAAVGQNMSKHLGAAASLFSALAKAGIDVNMISKGASEVNISCVIAEDDVGRALPNVHRAFFP